ncbi:hypothetical protein ACW2QC_14080 [Virgibacillus sp. FSP13]
MEKEEWMLQELERVYHNSSDYKQRALIEAARNIIKEQAKRITQMEGELDGTLWSPRNWSE